MSYKPEHELLNEFWRLVIEPRLDPQTGPGAKIYDEYLSRVAHGAPDRISTLSCVLTERKYGGVAEAVEAALKIPDEVRQQARQKWEAEKARQEQAAQERGGRENKERAILLSELSVLLPRWREVRRFGKLPEAAEGLQNASKADLERMPFADLQRGAEKLRAAIQVEEQRIQEEEAARHLRRKQESDASPVFTVGDLATVEPRFRYREPGERNLAAAEAVLCKYDRINLNYLRLLVALKGSAQQGQDTDALIVLVRGDTGAGKNTTLLLAADMLCCGLVECKIGKDRDALLSAYATAGHSRAFAVCNEVQDVWPGHLKVLPHLSKGSTFKLPYGRAESTVEQAAVFVMTAKTLPDGLLTDSALARRTILVELGRGARGLDWRAVGTVAGWRQRNPDAADDFISRELERFRDGKAPTARQIAADLGFVLLSDRMELVLRDFAAKLEATSKQSRYGGPEWRTIKRGARGHSTAELWQEFDRLRPALDEYCEVVFASGGKRQVFIRFPFLDVQEVPLSQTATEQGVAAGIAE